MHSHQDKMSAARRRAIKVAAGLASHGLPGAPSFEERFWLKVDKESGPVHPELGMCWIWVGAKGPRGYGVTVAGGPSLGTAKRMTQAHIVSYELANGKVPVGLELDHLCRVHSCVRPDHLEAVTHAENMRRAVWSEAGREAMRASQKRRMAKITHCRVGHPLFGENLYVDSRGRRSCKECHRCWTRSYRAAKRIARSAQ